MSTFRRFWVECLGRKIKVLRRIYWKLLTTWFPVSCIICFYFEKDSTAAGNCTMYISTFYHITHLLCIVRIRWHNSWLYNRRRHWLSYTISNYNLCKINNCFCVPFYKARLILKFKYTAKDFLNSEFHWLKFCGDI